MWVKCFLAVQLQGMYHLVNSTLNLYFVSIQRYLKWNRKNFALHNFIVCVSINLNNELCHQQLNETNLVTFHFLLLCLAGFYKLCAKPHFYSINCSVENLFIPPWLEWHALQITTESSYLG